jgi:cell division protein FtsB
VLFWIVLAVVLVLALVVLGIVGYGLLGAFGRLNRELAAAERDVQPLLDQVRATTARANELAERG